MFVDMNNRPLKVGDFVLFNNVRLTINAITYTIITAHLDGYGKCV